MVKFLVGLIAVIMFLVLASTVATQQKLSKMTAEQRTEYSRSLSGTNARCDQLQATATRIGDRTFDYNKCMRGR